MNRRRAPRALTIAGAVLAASSLVLAGCGRSGAPTQAGQGSGAAPTFAVDSAVALADSPTWERAKAADKLRIGVKFDQPGLGNKTAGAAEPAGFDIEIAELVAGGLGFAPDKIEWVETVSANREPFLQQNKVDLVVATYTINDKRKEVIDFAGPYYLAGQDLLVKADNTDITGVDSLAGKRVCSVTGSTPALRIAEEHKEAELVQYDTYSKCVTDLSSGSVDAVTTDDAILRGYAAQTPGQFKVVGAPFSEEPYGIGLPKGDTALRTKINDILDKAKADGDWQRAFTFTLGDANGVTAPAVDRY